MEKDKPKNEVELSRGWRYGVLLIMLIGFGVLIWIAGNTYHIGPPIPDKVIDSRGQILFSGDDIRAGQEVFLKHALMENGTIWGHGAYIGPDFSAAYLHQLVLDTRNIIARKNYGDSYDRLTEEQKASLKGEVHDLLSENRYAGKSGVLTFTEAETSSYQGQISRWTDFFANTKENRGLSSKGLSNPQELKQLTRFFAWTAWASAANLPSRNYSYTNNFPYDPDFGNGPSMQTVVWSALSLIALLAGTAAVLFAFGRFNYLGWRGERPHIHPGLLGGMLPSQRATLKFFVVVSLLFLAQVLAGGALAHFRAQPGSFYGYNLADVVPSNVLRSWHLQMAILWIATAFVGGGLFMASAIGRHEPAGQVKAINILFAALGIIVFGSLAGEYLGVKQLLGKLWFWFGNQGWEYLEIGRGWQVLLAIGLVFWVVLLIRAVGSARKDKEQGELSKLFLLSAFAIPIFYLPAFFFSSSTRFTVVDTWRFWIIHLWVEGFFELFVTVMVAIMFYKLSMVSRTTATRVIYLDAVLFLGSGIIGTGHHWYWTGQTNVSLALSATFSAMEVVPLILLTLDATDFTKLMRSKCDVCGENFELPHRWTFLFLISVGFWNFVGAGVFGFLINLPIVSYYEAGTNLTSNHGHAALMGVFGMLAIALMVFVMREMSSGQQWKQIVKYVRVSFWGLNIGLGLMMILNLFPTGVLQFADVVSNGYWHARSSEFSNGNLVTAMEWLRMPADTIFILFGAVPLAIAAILTYKNNILSKSKENPTRCIGL